MLRIPFLRNLLLVGAAIVLCMPLYTTLVLHPAYHQELVKNTEEESVRFANYLLRTSGLGGVRQQHAEDLLAVGQVGLVARAAQRRGRCGSHPFELGGGLQCQVDEGFMDGAAHALAGPWEYIHKMLDPQQQLLPDRLNTALEAAVQARTKGEAEAASKHLGDAIKLAFEMGYL